MLKKFPQQHLVHMFCYCGVPTGTRPIYHTNTAKRHKIFLYHLDGSSFTTLQSSYSMAIYIYIYL